MPNLFGHTTIYSYIQYFSKLHNPLAVPFYVARSQLHSCSYCYNFMMNDDRLILHNLHLITAYLSFITVNLCSGKPLYLGTNYSLQYKLIDFASEFLKNITKSGMWCVNRFKFCFSVHDYLVKVCAD